MTIDLGTPGGSDLAVGIEGQIADLSDSTIRSKVNSGASAIPFGRAVAKVPASGTVALISSTSDEVGGISVRDAFHPADASGVVAYLQYEDVSLLAQGSIYVMAYETAQDGDEAVALVTQNSDSETVPAGSFGSARNGKVASGRLECPHVFWDGPVTKGSIGKLRVGTGAVKTYSAT